MLGSCFRKWMYGLFRNCPQLLPGEGTGFLLYIFLCNHFFLTMVFHFLSCIAFFLFYRNLLQMRAMVSYLSREQYRIWHHLLSRFLATIIPQVQVYCHNCIFYYMNFIKDPFSDQCRYYVSLQKIYQAKAESDCLAIEHRVKSILKRIGRDPDSISRACIKTFCKNTRKLKVRCYLQGLIYL